MELRKNMLWMGVLYFPIASLISGYICLALSSFYIHRVTNADGTLSAVTDSAQEGLVNGGLLLAVLLIGGLVFFRTMTRKEIARSIGILSAIEIVIVLLDQLAPSLTSFLFIGPLWMLFSLFNMVAGYIAQVLPAPVLPALIAAFTPMLFVLFGKKASDSERSYL